MQLFEYRISTNDSKIYDSCAGWSAKFSSHLWIFDIRRAALGATDKSRRDIRIRRLPFDHEILGALEIGVFNHYLRVRLWARHEANLLQGRFIMNIGAQPCILEAPF